MSVDGNGWALLRAAAESLEDAQRLRIAQANRVARAPIADPEMFLPALAATAEAERLWSRVLVATYRETVPAAIREWAAGERGIGDLSLARLLGVIGHPVYTVRHRWEGTGAERELVVVGPLERRVSDLWSYAGHGDATRRRRAGQSAQDAAASGNPRAKTRTFLLAVAVIRSGNARYREVYDAARARSAAAHPEWTAGHAHQDALRRVGKELLRDLWRVSAA